MSPLFHIAGFVSTLADEFDEYCYNGGDRAAGANNAEVSQTSVKIEGNVYFVCEEDIADLKDSPVTLIINSTECQGISRANARRVCQPRECEARSPTGDETPIEGVCYSESGDGKRGVHAPSAAREWRSGAEYDVVESTAYGAVYPQKGTTT